MRETYEARYQEFCRQHRLDPESTASVLTYEQEWEEEMSGDTDEEWRPDV